VFEPVYGFTELSEISLNST